MEEALDIEALQRRDWPKIFSSYIIKELNEIADRLTQAIFLEREKLRKNENIYF